MAIPELLKDSIPADKTKGEAYKEDEEQGEGILQASPVLWGGRAC